MSKKEKRLTRSERLAGVKTNLDKAYGPGHLRSGGDPFKSGVIPVNCLPFDSMLGGGFLTGAFHLLWGWQAGGKTTTCLKALANAQKMCSYCRTFIQPQQLFEPFDELAEPGAWRAKRYACVHCAEPYHLSDRPPKTLGKYRKDRGEKLESGESGKWIYCDGCGSIGPPLGEDDCPVVPMEDKAEWKRIDGDYMCDCGKSENMVGLFVDFEGALDEDWAKALGVDVGALLIEEPEYGQAGLDIVREVVRQGVVDFVVIDSIANIVSSVELDQTSEDYTVAATARLVNSFLRQVPGLIASARNKFGVQPTILATNQVRHKIGGYGGHSLFGGEGQKFAATTITKFTSSKPEMDEVTVGAETRRESLGLTRSVDIKAQCEKSKMRSARGLDAQFRLMTTSDSPLVKGEFDDYTLTMKQGKKADVIRKLGAKHEFYRKGLSYYVEGWPVTFSSLTAITNEMHRNQFFKMHIHREIIERVHGDWEGLKELLT